MPNVNSNTHTTTGAGNTTAAQTNDRGEILAVWVIVGTSFINQFRWCIIGEGDTEAAAWRESGRTPRKSRGAWAEHISWEHYHRIMEASY
jgi:hypothetical protein